MKRGLVAFVALSVMLVSCSGRGASPGTTDPFPWFASPAGSEWSSGISIGALPNGFAFSHNEGHETAVFHVFGSEDDRQFAVGRQLAPYPFPTSGNEVTRDGRTFTVTGEIRVFEELPGGVRIEVVSQSLDEETLLRIAESVDYDPDGDAAAVEAFSPDASADELQARAMARALLDWGRGESACIDSSWASVELEAALTEWFPTPIEYYEEKAEIETATGDYRCVDLSPRGLTTIRDDVVGVDVWVWHGSLDLLGVTYLFKQDGIHWRDTTPEETGVTVTSMVS